MPENVVDWQEIERLLFNASNAAIRAFLSQRPIGTICAIGYVFELGNYSPQFDICANTQSYLITTFEECRAKCPSVAQDAIRWNSGDFEFPAGLPGKSYHDAWLAWELNYVQLHNLANRQEDMGEVYHGLVSISCNVLAEIASGGLIADWSNIDFNVASVDDGILLVKERDEMIRKLIAKRAAAAL